MRQALQSDLRTREGAATTIQIPAPVAGWNARDPLATLGYLDAVQLINIFPEASECRLRGGYSTHATGSVGMVKSLFSFAANSAGDSKLFACSDSGIYNVTTSGAIGAAAHTLTNGYCSGVNFTNSANGNFLVIVNGTDKVKQYNGTTWQDIDNVSTPAITGVTTTNLDYVWSFKRRLWFVEKNTMKAWFLPVDSIGGAATSMNLGPLFKLGGRLVAGTSWSLDGGDGMDDYCVFLSSEGEVAIYRGTDPTSALSWSLVGVYYIGRPAGKRVFARYGGEVIVMTDFGVVPLSRALSSSGISYKETVTDKIRQAFITARNLGATLSGWEVLVHAAQGALIVNVPLSESTFEQFVMNTVTGSWCKFQGWDGYCFEVHDGGLYFGKNGAVVRAWSGYSDGGADIKGTAQTAYLDFKKKKTGLKRPTLFRPLLFVDGAFSMQWGFSPDHAIPATFSGSTNTAGATAAVWDVSAWDEQAWSDVPMRHREWRTVTTIPGYSVSLLLQFTSKDTTITWSGTDFAVLPGGQV